MTTTHKPRSVAFFRSVHRDADGTVLHDSGDRHNLRTTTGIDWQSLAMGGGLVNATYATGTAAAVSATTVTLPTSGAPGSTSVWNNQIITLGAVWGIILSNTNVSPPVVTIDGWHTATAPGTIGSTPSTGVYIILQGAAPIQYLALTASVITPNIADTTLGGELATNGFTRAFGTYAHTPGTASYSLAKTFTCTGGSTTINTEAIFLGVTGSTMAFESQEPSPPTLINNDTLAQTVTVSF